MKGYSFFCRPLLSQQLRLLTVKQNQELDDRKKILEWEIGVNENIASANCSVVSEDSITYYLR